MYESHRAYLSLGSNIGPELHLVTAIQRLHHYGTVENISNAWESESVGEPGPNYLNACVLLITAIDQWELKNQVLHPLEAELGRRRSEDKFAPRTLDIDIVLFDDQSCDDKYWEQVFVVVPLAEIYPTYENPLTKEPLEQTAARLRSKFWVKPRPEVLRSFQGSSFTD